MTQPDKINRLSENIEKVFIGKSEVVKLLIIGLLAQGHLLIEDVPGVGKTILARARVKKTSSKVKFRLERTILSCLIICEVG